MITQETRLDSLNKLNRNERFRQIIECLKEKDGQTAKEMACSMLAKGYIPFCDRNFTAPRMTELQHLGILKVTGKRECKWTHKMVAVYELAKDPTDIF